jgi:hypothetical protein
MGVLPTVKIKAENEQGYIIINEDDFVEGEHELFDEAPKDELTEEEILAADLEDLKLPQLQIRAKAAGLEGVSRINRPDLIIAIAEAEEALKTDGD